MFPWCISALCGPTHTHNMPSFFIGQTEPLVQLLSSHTKQGGVKTIIEFYHDVYQWHYKRYHDIQKGLKLLWHLEVQTEALFKWDATEICIVESLFTCFWSLSTTTGYKGPGLSGFEHSSDKVHESFEL